MAQIALRKTANENKVEYPKAAEVLEKNTYMDDICESVDTKQEAGELTDRSTPIKPQRNNPVVLVLVRLGTLKCTILFLRLKKEIYLRTFLKALTKTISS